MDVEAFIERWRRCDNGSERGNAAMYLREMMDALGLPPPEPSSDADYRFERSVPRRLSDRPGPGGFIDLYKDGCFVLEAKQSRIVRDGPLSREDREALACPSRSRRAGWDNLMQSARTQALGYVQALSPDRRTPPFILLCDVANVFEVWADFTGTGRGYDPFPDRATYRIAHEDLSVIAALAALNAERVDEERRGLIRWRRPAIQTAASRGRPVSAQPELTTGHGSSRSGVLIPFPTSPIEQPLAIEAVIRAAETPLDAIAVSRRFRRSRQIESRVGVVLGTLHRYSRIHRLDDGRYQSRATI